MLRPQRFAKSGRVMEWIHPLTGAVSRRLELGDVERFQVLDADTLLATGRKTAQLIDLATGNVKTFSIPPLSNQDDDEDTVSRSSVDDGSATDAPSQPPSITTDEQRPRQELFAYADPASIYLTELPSQNRPTALRMMGVRVSPLNSWMQAIDRETGQMRWQISPINYRLTAAILSSRVGCLRLSVPLASVKPPLLASWRRAMYCNTVPIKSR